MLNYQRVDSCMVVLLLSQGEHSAFICCNRLQQTEEFIRRILVWYTLALLLLDVLFGKFCANSCGKVGELYMNSDLKTFLHVDCSSSRVLVGLYVIVAAVGIHGSQGWICRMHCCRMAGNWRNNLLATWNINHNISS